MQACLETDGGFCREVGSNWVEGMRNRGRPKNLNQLDVIRFTYSSMNE